MSANSPLSRRETFGLLLLSLGVALIVVDMSIVNLVLPQIAHGPGCRSPVCNPSVRSSPSPRRPW